MKKKSAGKIDRRLEERERDKGGFGGSSERSDVGFWLGGGDGGDGRVGVVLLGRRGLGGAEGGAQEGHQEGKGGGLW